MTHFDGKDTWWSIWYQTYHGIAFCWDQVSVGLNATIVVFWKRPLSNHPFDPSHMQPIQIKIESIEYVWKQPHCDFSPSQFEHGLWKVCHVHGCPASLPVAAQTFSTKRAFSNACLESRVGYTRSPSGSIMNARNVRASWGVFWRLIFNRCLPCADRAW